LAMTASAEHIQLGRAELRWIANRPAASARFHVGCAWPVAGLAAHTQFRGLDDVTGRERRRTRGVALETTQSGRGRIERAKTEVGAACMPRRRRHRPGRRVVTRAVFDILTPGLAHVSNRLRPGAERPLTRTARRGPGQRARMSALRLRFEL